MRRLLVLAVLLGMFLGLRSLRVDAVGLGDTFLLAAIGFVVLASFTAAELGSGLRLPRVTGYIVAGILLGPAVGDILSTEVVEQMTMFNTLALGLIAIGAGLELEVAALWRLRRTLGTTVLAKVVLTGGAVFATFVAIELTFKPLGLSSRAHVFSVGLVLATLALGTSPSITMAVISELRARGRVADLTLGAAVVKDLVLVVLLAIATSIAAAWLGMRGAGESSIAGVIARELGGSIGLGLAVGGLILLYLRFVHAEMLLFITVLILGVAEVSRFLHLDLLLVFIAAGFVVRNFSKRAADVMHPLETVALPVFVVFFTIAGARMDLQATWVLLPLAATLAIVRGLTFFIANQIGARVGRETSDVRSRMWLAYLPQAGVTLGLLGVARHGLPAIAKELGDIEIAVVAINLLLGPIALRRALQGPGSQESPTNDGSEPVSEFPSEPPDASAPRTTSVRVRQEPSLSDPEIERQLSALTQELNQRARELLRDEVRPSNDVLSRTLSDVFEAEATSTRRQRLHSWASQHPSPAMAQRAGEAARSLIVDFDQRLLRLPAEMALPVEPAAYDIVPKASFRLRMRVVFARLRRALARKPVMRRVPVRSAARIALMPRLASVSVQLVGSWSRAYAGVLDDLRRHAAGELSSTEACDAISERLTGLEETFRSDIAVALAQGIDELVDLLRWVDSPRLPSSEVRYSRVEPQTRTYLELLSRQPAAWAKLLGRAEDALLLTTGLARVEAGVEAVLEKEVLLPLADAGEALVPGASAARALLERGADALRSPELTRESWSVLVRELAEARATRDDTASSRSGFRAATALHATAVELRQLVEALPEAVDVPLARTPAYRAAAPEDVSLRRVALRAEARRELVLDFVPIVDAEGQRAADAVQDFNMRIGDALEMARHAIELALESSVALDREALESGIERASAHLEQGATETRATLIGAHDAIERALETALLRLRSLGGAITRAHVAGAEKSGLRTQIAQISDSFARRSRQLSRSFTKNAQHWGLSELWRRQREGAGDTRTRRLVAQQLRSGGDAPPSYARLFRLSPLRDRRLSIAHQDVLAAVIAAEREWLRGGPGSVLIVADPGAGKTSLLNLCQIELSAPRVIRPEPVRARRDVGVMPALAYELGRSPFRKDVGAALTAHRTVVLLDDLEQWFSPDVDGVRELRSFLDLVAKTRVQTAWIVTVSRQFLDAWADVVDVRAMFANVIDVPALDAATLRRVIEARHSASGLSLVHRRGPLRALFGRFGQEEQFSFRVLRAVSGGNLSAALAAWPHCLRFEEGRVLVQPEHLLKHRQNLLQGLRPVARASLMLIMRHGPMSLRSLADALDLTHSETEREIVSLESAGLLSQAEGSLLVIPTELKGLLIEQLPGELAQEA